MVTNSLNTITDHKPIYITSDGKVHRTLTECYDLIRPFEVKPLLVLTYEEYQVLNNTETLHNLIKELT
jgi:hypothetical protein